MKRILLLSLYILTTVVYAQKTYVDPNEKVKKGLLEPGEKVESPAKAETASKEEPTKSKLTPEQARYCSCLEFIRIQEKKIELAKSLNEKNAMPWQELHSLTVEANLEKYNGLLKKYEATSGIDSDEFECEIYSYEAKKPKDFKKYLDQADKSCKFQEIERKSL